MGTLPKYFYFRVRVKGLMTVEIEDASDVDVVEVVRCRDCVHGEVDDPDFPDQYLCHFYGDDWNDGMHYCSHGERRIEIEQNQL